LCGLRTICSSCSTELQASPVEARPREDSFGYTWIIVRDSDLEDQVTTIHAVAQGLEEQGFGSQLLAAVFSQRRKHPVY